MSRIEGWKRVNHYNLDDEQVREEIDELGSAEIAAWRHEATGTRLTYLYEPRAERPYLVKLLGRISREEEGRYPTREAGGTANKRLMRKNTSLPTASSSRTSP